jgi:hypothetical protein
MIGDTKRSMVLASGRTRQREAKSKKGDGTNTKKERGLKQNRGYTGTNT